MHCNTSSLCVQCRGMWCVAWRVENCLIWNLWANRFRQPVLHSVSVLNLVNVKYLIS